MIATLLSSGAAQAEVRISGTADELTLSADGDTVESALTALARRFDITLRASAPLTRDLYGTYSGSLGQVVTKLLRGQNFVLRRDRGMLEILVFAGDAASRSSTKTVTGAPPKDASLLSRWR